MFWPARSSRPAVESRSISTLPCSSQDADLGVGLLVLRDQEVGGSNPLAPTVNKCSTTISVAEHFASRELPLISSPKLAVTAHQLRLGGVHLRVVRRIYGSQGGGPHRNHRPDRGF